MTAEPPTSPRLVRTTAGDFPLREYRLSSGGREWTALHAGAVVSREEEARFLAEAAGRLPYGVTLWPSSLALAHEVAARHAEFRGKTVLELGAGTGLPGIVAATFGARVVQTDRHEAALTVCRKNGERNGVPQLAEGDIDYRLADWGDWHDPARYDWILGSDILYADTHHPYLRRIFEANLAPGGRILLSDPLRAASLPLLEALEADGWAVSLNRWDIGEGDARPVGVFDLSRSPEG